MKISTTQFVAHRTPDGRGIRRLTASAVCCAVVVILFARCSDEALKQRGSQAELFFLAVRIAGWKSESGKWPPSLAAVCDKLEKPQECKMEDLWGRPYYYRVTYHQDGYVLASFGKDGMPDRDAGSPGAFGSERDYDADIVVVSGAWAQSVEGLERPVIRPPTVRDERP